MDAEDKGTTELCDDEAGAQCDAWLVEWPLHPDADIAEAWLCSRCGQVVIRLRYDPVRGTYGE